MQRIDFFLTVQKLFLIAHAMDHLLTDDYADLIHDGNLARNRTFSALITGVSELYHGLESLAMADPQGFADD